MTIETASAKIRDVSVNDEPEDYDFMVWAGLMPLNSLKNTQLQIRENHRKWKYQNMF